MVERFLGDSKSDIFLASMSAHLGMEKLAADKPGILDAGKEGIKGYLTLLMKGMTLGAATGGLAGYGYNALSEALGGYDAEQGFSDRVAAMYRNRERELLDSRWMDKVRAMRDDLRRNYKKMTPDEYRTQYNALVDALDERRG